MSLLTAFALCTTSVVEAQWIAPDEVAEQAEGAPSEDDAEVGADSDDAIPDPPPDPRAAGGSTSSRAHEPPRPTLGPRRPWHTGRFYAQLAFSGSAYMLPLMRVGTSPVPGLAFGLEYTVQPFGPPLVFGDSHRGNERFDIHTAHDLSAFATYYPYTGAFHVDAGLGAAFCKYAIVDDAGTSRSASGRGPRVWLGFGAEWRHPRAAWQHWGIGLALIVGVSHVRVEGHPIGHLDLSILTTLTRF